jgi:hypothetical protein
VRGRENDNRRFIVFTSANAERRFPGQIQALRKRSTDKLLGKEKASLRSVRAYKQCPGTVAVPEERGGIPGASFNHFSRKVEPTRSRPSGSSGEKTIHGAERAQSA